LTVSFIVGEKKLPDFIKTDVSLNRSIPYELLVTTDKSYVVLSQTPVRNQSRSAEIRLRES